MHRIKIRKIISGTGVFMLSVFVTAAVIHLNDWMKGHVWAVTFVMYASIFISTICFLYWFLLSGQKGHDFETKSPANEQSVIAPAIAQAGNIHFAPVIQVGSVEGSTASLGTPLATGVETDHTQREALPDLELSFTYGSVTQEDDAFVFAEGGKKCIGVRVYNRPAAKLESANVARNIVASVYLSIGSIGANVECSYWIGKVENQIDLKPGAYADALLAIPSQHDLTMFHNRNLLPRSSREWNAIVDEPEPIPFVFPRPVEIEGQIYIISRGNNIRHITLAHKRFLITLGDEASPLTSLKVRWTG